MPKDAITTKKSFRDGHVAIRIVLKASGYIGDSASVTGDTELTTTQARALALELTVLADAADAKVQAKAEAEERREKYRAREIAAGRMVVMEWGR